jgi:hypothetical protein
MCVTGVIMSVTVSAHGPPERPTSPIDHGSAVTSALPADVLEEATPGTSTSWPQVLQERKDRGPGPAIVTHRGDSFRSGVNRFERTLTHDNVRSAFGKLYEIPVDGQVYAQPLYVPGAEITGSSQPRNVLIVATMKNHLYAFDADVPPSSTQPYLWRADLGKPVEVPEMKPAWEYKDVIGPIGIFSTPYIDLSAKMIYVVSLSSLEDRGPTYRLFKIALESGLTVASREISGHLPGDGPDAVILAGQKVIPFNPIRQLQRPALTFHKDYIHVAFGAIGDMPDYHGWIFSYKTSDLSGGPSFNTSPVATSTDPGGGIWQSGLGLTLDDSDNVYVATGNGDFSPGLGDWGNSFLKLRFAVRDGKFHVIDYFTPYNQADLDEDDLDVGSAGVLFIPPKYLLGGAKSGHLYVLDRDHMGGYTPEAGRDKDALQVFRLTEPSEDKTINGEGMWNIHGAPIEWKDRVYVMGETDPVKMFPIDKKSGLLNETPFSQSMFAAPLGMPGGFLTLSLDEKNPESSAILWVSHPFQGNANQQTRPGIVHAFNAYDMTDELWRSRRTLPDGSEDVSDDLGNFAKFCPPVVAGGKLYMATFSDRIVVYGLK